MKSDSLFAIVASLVIPLGITTYGAVSEGIIDHNGLFYWLVFLFVPPALIAANILLANKASLEKFFVWVAIIHTVLWVLGYALNSLIMSGELYNLIAMPALVLCLVLSLPFSLYSRFRPGKQPTSQA